ncbi:MAG: phospho-N-acetylmuramoyl-pentapeptide-transferase [Cyanobacteria bacterium P01_D01_bin.123]
MGQTPVAQAPIENSAWWQRWGGSMLSLLAIAILTAGIAGLAPLGLLPFVAALVLSAAAGYAVVPLLRWWKTGQIMREDGPKGHLSKAGTPTMGGIFFVPVGLLVALWWTQASPVVMGASAISLACGFIGWLDDYQVIRAKSNKGLSARLRLFLQCAIGAVACWIFAHTGLLTSDLNLPGLALLPLGWLFWPLAIFALVGSNNAVNLTDGLDGLAAGTVAIALLGLGLLLAPTQPELAVFAFALCGSCAGFLVHNRNPARTFMGDTGSLALGGAVAAIAILGNCLWALAVMGGVFVTEALSVMAQVGYFKYTKRQTGEGQRLLRMAPLHHHLELGGWPELKVVAALYAVGFGLALSGYILSHL